MIVRKQQSRTSSAHIATREGFGEPVKKRLDKIIDDMLNEAVDKTSCAEDKVKENNPYQAPCQSSKIIYKLAVEACTSIENQFRYRQALLRSVGGHV